MKKNIEEILQNADPAVLDGMFDTIKAEKTNEKNIRNKVLGKNKSGKNPMIWRIIPVAASFAVIVTACALVIPRIVTGQQIKKPQEEYDSSFNALLRLKNFDRIIWSEQSAPAYLPSDSETVEYNGLRITKELYDRLQNASDGDLFALTAKRNIDIPENFEDFVYEGKKGSEYKKELYEASRRYGAIMEIKECSDGKEEGSEEGSEKFNKWVKAEIIEEYGEEFLSRYYHNGKFDLKNISDDAQKADEEVYFCERANNEAYNAYADAAYPHIYAFREYNGIEVYNGYHAETDTHYYIMIVTKAQLAKLKADYDNAEKTVGEFDFENSYFSLVPYPEEDIKYMQDEETAYVTAIPEDPNQIPETTAE